MNVLICNDDGYQSLGIQLLARVVGEFANVRVLAPDRDRSAVSNSLTLDRPLTVKQSENGFYYLNGTPTDCVHLASHVLDDFKPDWVFSGINHGANMGDDTLYSGTVAAATEGYLLNIPSVAFSLDDTSDRYWETAEKALWPLVRFILAQDRTSPFLWNVNIPRVAPEDLQGIKTVSLGRRHHGQGVIKSNKPNGDPVYWIGTIGHASDASKGTDFHAIDEGFVTITPLTVDLTSKDTLSQVSESFRHFCL